MSLTRLYTAETLSPGEELSLGEEAARYLGRVLRMKVGDRIHVFNGEQGEWRATIRRFGHRRVVLLVEDPVETKTESPLDLHLIQGVSRGERMDFVVQKATELGVSRITPVLTDYGVVRLDLRRSTRRREHWQGIAENACEQSGRIRPPAIDAPLPLNDWFGAGREAPSRKLVLHAAAAATLPDAAPGDDGLCLLIGPEGGFSDRELDDAALAGFEAVSLGPRILRTETAAVAAIAIAQSRWGDV